MSTEQIAVSDSVKQSVNNNSETTTNNMKENTITKSDSKLSVNNTNERWVIYNPSKVSSVKVKEIIERNEVLLEDAIDSDESEDVINERRNKLKEWMIKGGSIKQRNKIDVDNGDVMVKKISIKNTPTDKRNYFIKLGFTNND
jgi:hypothetical protein